MRAEEQTMQTISFARFMYVAVLSISLLAFGLSGCGGGGGDGPAGPEGPPGSEGPPGPPASSTGEIIIGDGSELTEAQIEALGRLQATIDSITVSSRPVVEFTVLDSDGDPALGLAPGVVQFTFAKLKTDPTGKVNGGLAYWQSYINRQPTCDPSIEGVDCGDPLRKAVQATTDSQGTLEELGAGKYRYTFATDVTSVTDPIAVPWEPSLTHRTGLEIRLSGPAEVPLAPFNPVYDFVPDGGAGTGVGKDIADTRNCNGCHIELAVHGGPRKRVEYCVTCHNPGSIDPDSGNSLDMAHLAHSIHMGNKRPIPYIIYGFGGSEHNYGEVTYPQSQTYCETCHTATESHPEGDAWNKGASAKSCGGCHADGLVAVDPDPVTGQPSYSFDHVAAGADAEVGSVPDGLCNACHLGGTFPQAGPALAVHSRIAGDQRFREALGENFVYEILSATHTAPGEKPVIAFKVSHPDGTPYDIVNNPEFSTAGASLNLYVAWTTDDIYNGDQTGATWGLRDTGTTVDQVEEPGSPYRMDLAALQRDAVPNADGSYTVTYFAALPTAISGDVMIALGGHPIVPGVLDANLKPVDERAAARSAVFYPGTRRQFAVTAEQCNVCHKQLQFHGANRNGNVEICLVCHTADTAIGGEGYQFGRLIHSIHSASATFAGGAFADVTYPQIVANCDTCHVEGRYNTARATARAVSTGPGGDDNTWLNDISTTPTAAACGVCHTSAAANGHFESQGAQVGVEKQFIVGAPEAPTGQEGCVVCHGPGKEFDTVQFHNPGIVE
jgi:OmcA/MtrC family decaheme c-type cytochrome